MPVKFIFFDIHESIIKAHQKALENIIPNSEFISGDIRKITQIDVYISPANSYGWMSGGIDAIYSKMFPGIQELVKTRIAEVSPLKTTKLPVGSALITRPGQMPNNKLLICAPTMGRPGCNIRNNMENVYYAAIAIFKICEQLPSGTVVGIPGLGTGVGGLTGDECANLIANAWTDIKNDQVIYPKGSKIDYTKEHLLVTPCFLH